MVQMRLQFPTLLGVQLFQHLPPQSNPKMARKFREPHLNLSVRMSFLPLALISKGEVRKVSYEPGGSDVVRELLRESTMFQIGL